MTELPPAIEVKDVSFHYRSSTSFALSGVSLNVHPGEIVGLIGPNGAGKTTLMRLMTGFLRPMAGSVRIDGMDPEDLRVRARMGYQADAPYSGNDVTVRRFLQCHALLCGVEDAMTHALELAGSFGINEYLDQRMGRLSKGNQQKAELVQAFVGNPEVVFLDEPTDSLDPPSVFMVREFLGKQREAGRAILFNSHNLTEVEKICSRVYIILNGTIVAEYNLGQASGIDLEEVFRMHMKETIA